MRSGGWSRRKAWRWTRVDDSARLVAKELGIPPTPECLADPQTRHAIAEVEALDRSQAVIEFGLDGTILDANENLLKMSGYTLAEVKGKHHSIFVGPIERESARYRDFWASLNRG